jgi:peroxiredoxin
MNPPSDLLSAKDPDIPASFDALRRAAQLARKTAIHTNTNIVILQEGQLIHVSAQELRETATRESTHD